MYRRKAQVGVRAWAWSHRYRVNGADDTSSNCLTVALHCWRTLTTDYRLWRAHCDTYTRHTRQPW